jgi:nitrite reductase/ring-hydroxylating ferredoxin subunit
MSGPVLIVEASADVEGWMPLGTLESVFNGGLCRSAKIDDTHVGLFRIDGECFAIDDICSHGNARLTEGDVDGFEVECPLHAGVFDLRTGKALTAPLTRDVNSHPLKLVDGQLYIQITR